jgi:hypothetical protein
MRVIIPAENRHDDYFIIIIIYLFLRGLIEGTATARVLSSRNRREKEDRIEESQPFRERNLSLQDKIATAALTRQTRCLPSSKPTRLEYFFSKTIV